MPVSSPVATGIFSGCLLVSVYGVRIPKNSNIDIVTSEMRKLRWTCGVTKIDRIRKERIRWTTKVGEISKKVQERRQSSTDISMCH